MQRKFRVSTVGLRSWGEGDGSMAEYSSVFYYLLSGISLLIAVIFFLPRFLG